MTPQIPPQNIPLSDRAYVQAPGGPPLRLVGGLFCLTWYLFFDEIRQVLDYILGVIGTGSQGDPTLVPLTFQHGWSASATVLYGVPSVCLLSSRQLLIFGYITGGTATDATVIFTLPVGYRPQRQSVLPIAAYTGAGTVLAPAYLLFKTNGDVQIFGVTAGWFLHLDVTLPAF